MTSLKCHRCTRYWTVTTNWPDTFEVIQRFCPDCIPAVLPRMGTAAMPRRTA